MAGSRLDRIRERIGSEGLDALLVTGPQNRQYLSGFTGSAGMLLITLAEALLITDFRYVEQASTQAPLFKVVQAGVPMLGTVRAELEGRGVKRAGFEQDHLTYGQFLTHRDGLPGIELVPCEGWVEKLRMVKDPTELGHIRAAVAATDAAFEHVLGFLRPGLTEREVALEVEFFLRKQTGGKAAFDVIAASGPNSSLPHAVPTDRVLQRGDFVKLDFGASSGYYVADLTRTVVLGEASSEQRAIYDIVLEAQLTAIAAVAPGKTGLEVDKVARAFLTAAGYGENFGHGLGHGIGLVVHESPRLNTSDETVLQPGMVCTVEPGVYIPNWGGVRIEDDVVVTDKGCEVLTKSRKDLIVLG